MQLYKIVTTYVRNVLKSFATLFMIVANSSKNRNILEIFRFCFHSRQTKKLQFLEAGLQNI